MNKRPPIPVIVVAVLAIAGGIAWWFGPSRESTSHLYGNVDIRDVDLAFRVGGRLTEMRREEGDQVKAGDIVATLEATPLIQALAAADARVAQAQAVLAKLEHGPRQQEIGQARAAVQEAEAGLRDAQGELARQQGLVAEGATSRKLLEAARARAEQAAARRDAVRQQLALLLEGTRSEDLAATHAELDAALAARAQAATRLDDGTLRAPQDGVVLARIREPGAMVPEGAPVYTLSLVRPVYVRAYARETELARLVPGTAVTLRGDSTRAYRGRVGFVSTRAEFTPKSVETEDLRTDLVYRLRIVVEDADSALRQGMPVTIQLGGAPS